jgi:hypothetical protein
VQESDVDRSVVKEARQLFRQLAVGVGAYGAAPQKTVIGGSGQSIAFVLGDDRIEGAFDRLCFRRDTK